MGLLRKGLSQPKIRIAMFIVLLIAYSGTAYRFNQLDEIGYNEQGGSSYVRYEKARVLEVANEALEKDANIDGLYRGTQQLSLKLLSGEHKGEVVSVTNYLSTMYNVHAAKGMKIITVVDTADASHYSVSVFSYYRAPLLYGMIGVFLAVLWAIGGKKGLKSAAGLVFTFASIIFLFIPMLYRGYSPMMSAILVVTATVAVTLLLLDGWSSKSLSAIAGTLVGIILAGVLAAVSGELLHVSGFNAPDSETLILIADGTGMHVQGLLFAGILIASLGAIMDVGISVASSVHEVFAANRGLGTRALFRAGMNVGRDMMGTMATTLILAFTGSSLMSLIVLYSYKIPYNQLVNMNLVTIEVMQGITGGIGVILTVPIVAFISARLMPYYDRIGKKTEAEADAEADAPAEKAERIEWSLQDETNESSEKAPADGREHSIAQL